MQNSYKSYLKEFLFEYYHGVKTSIYVLENTSFSSWPNLINVYKIYLPQKLLLALKHHLHICFITEEFIWITYGTCSYISTFPWRVSLFCSLDKQSNEWKCWGFEFFKKEMARVTITKELNVAYSASTFSKALFLPLKMCNHSNMQYSGFLSGELANWSNSRFIEDQNEYNIYWV